MRHDEVQVAVLVQIDKGRSQAHRRQLFQVRLCGHILEASLAGVAKKMSLADAGDENVGETVVVVIADGHAHSVKLDVESCAARYVRECAVAIVAVEAKSRTLALVTGPVHSIDQKNVLPAVAVVVEERAAGAQRFG